MAEARAYHDWVSLWKHEKTWSIYSTGLVVDMRVHFDLPAAHYDMHVIGGYDMAPPVILYSARRADGTEVTVTDSNPENRGNVLRRRAQSDSTVPDPSGEGLFPGQRHPVVIGTDYETHRQFRISGAAHDAICHNANCERSNQPGVEWPSQRASPNNPRNGARSRIEHGNDGAHRIARYRQLGLHEDTRARSRGQLPQLLRGHFFENGRFVGERASERDVIPAFEL